MKGEEKSRLSYVRVQCNDMAKYVNEIMINQPNIPSNTMAKFVQFQNYLSFAKAELDSIINDHKIGII